MKKKDLTIVIGVLLIGASVYAYQKLKGKKSDKKVLLEKNKENEKDKIIPVNIKYTWNADDDIVVEE